MMQGAHIVRVYYRLVYCGDRALKNAHSGEGVTQNMVLVYGTVLVYYSVRSIGEYRKLR
jgi:hypothetical protein